MDIATPASAIPSSSPLMPDGAPAGGSETTTAFGDLLAGALPGTQALASTPPAEFSAGAGGTSDDEELLPDLQNEFLTGLADARASATPADSGAIPAMASTMASIVTAATPPLPTASAPAEFLPGAGDEPRSRAESAAAAIPAALSAENPYSLQNARATDTGPGIISTSPATVPLPAIVQVSAHTQSAAAVVEHAVIELPIRHADWPGAFAQRVSWTVLEKLQSAQLILNPPELGPVEIRVTVDREEASLLFVAAQPAVRNAIEQALPVLRENLLQSGIHLGNTEISSGNPQQPPEDAQGQTAQDGNSHATSASGSPPIVAGAIHHGLVDIYA